MTNRDAINLLEEVKILDDTMYAYNPSYLEALDMAITALEAEETWYATHEHPPKPHWIPCSERLPEEDHWLGGSGRQFSDEVLVSVANYDDEDIWTYISQTIDGEWALELPSHCKIIAWMPLPKPYEGRQDDQRISN